MLLAGLFLAGLSIVLASDDDAQKTNSVLPDHSKINELIETVSSLKLMAELHATEITGVSSKMRILGDTVKEIKAASISQFSEIKAMFQELDSSLNDLKSTTEQHRQEMSAATSQLKDLIETAALNSQVNEKRCPNGFEKLSSVGCYQVIRERLPWSAAAARCQQVHSTAHLAFLNSQQKQTAVENWLSSMGTSIRYPWANSGGRPGMWIGGQRRDPDNSRTEFVWKRTCNDTSPLRLGYTNWHHGEPNNWRGSVESCIQIDLREGSDWKWNDVDCSLSVAFVCEVDL